MAGGDDNIIKERECDKCRTDIQKRIEEVNRVTEKRLDAHAEQADRIERLLVEVVTLGGVQAKQLEASEKRLHIMETAVITQQAQAKLKSEEKVVAPIYKERWFIVVVVTMCAVFIGTLSVAIGLNIFDFIDKLP